MSDTCIDGMPYVKRTGWPQVRINLAPDVCGLVYADAAATVGESGNTITYEASGIVVDALRQYYAQAGRLPAAPAAPRRTVT